MARIRSIKPELRRSLTVASWKREVRYAWVLLWGYLDDYGYGVDDLRLITSDLFPLDRDVTERKMDSWLEQMTQPIQSDTDDAVPTLCRFSAGGRHYLHAVKWSEHQRPAHPSASKFPACPIHGPTAWPDRSGGKQPQSEPAPAGHSPAPHEPLTNASGDIPESLMNGSGTIPLAPTRAPAETGDGRRETGDGSSSGSLNRNPSLADARDKRVFTDRIRAARTRAASGSDPQLDGWDTDACNRIAGNIASRYACTVEHAHELIVQVANLPNVNGPQVLADPGAYARAEAEYTRIQRDRLAADRDRLALDDEERHRTAVDAQRAAERTRAEQLAEQDPEGWERALQAAQSAVKGKPVATLVRTRALALYAAPP